MHEIKRPAVRSSRIGLNMLDSHGVGSTFLFLFIFEKVVMVGLSNAPDFDERQGAPFLT